MDEETKSRIPVRNKDKQHFFNAIKNIYGSVVEFLLQILILFLNQNELIKVQKIATTNCTREEYNVKFEVNINQRELQNDSENRHYDVLPELEIHTQIIKVTMLNDLFDITINVTGIIGDYTGEIQDSSNDFDFFKIMGRYMNNIEQNFQEFVNNTGMGLFNSFRPFELDTTYLNPYCCYTSPIQNEISQLRRVSVERK